jgi:hypothetical protein
MTDSDRSREYPIQLAMLGLAGYVIDDEEAIEDEKRKAIARGRWRLRCLTDQDFGFDVEKWHDYLLQHEVGGYYCCPDIEASFSDPIRLRLVATLEQEPVKLSTEGLAIAIVEALIRERIVEDSLQRIVPVVRNEIELRKILGEY